VGPFLNDVPVGTLVGAGELFDDLGQAFGWWGGSPFHGNVAASQSGKSVLTFSIVNIPGPPTASQGYPGSSFDPTDPTYQLAVALGQSGAYTIEDPRFVLGFYGATAAAAAAIEAPAALASLDSMDVAAGLTEEGELHFAYGAEGQWAHFVGEGADGFETTHNAASFAENAFKFRLPVLSTESIIPGVEAGATTCSTNCFLAVWNAFLRGWL
jgi:hypothetical protein